MSEKVRVMRILVYEGTREWVEKTLQNNGVPLDGTRHVAVKDGIECLIKSAIIDKFPEILEDKHGDIFLF